MSKQQPVPAKNPDAAKGPDAPVSGRFFRFFRGKGDYAAFTGVESVTVQNGRVVSVKEEKFPTVFNVAEGVLLSEAVRERDGKA